MKILALDSSTATSVFAAVEINDGAIVRAASRVLPQARQLSRESVLALAGALADAGWRLDDVDAIAAGLGPGSWTGLRIGLTVAKTLAQARELPLFGVPTFDALAEAGRAVRICDYCRILVVAPCRAGEIYARSWETRDLDLVPLGAERIVTPAQLADEIMAAAPSWMALIFTPGAGALAAQEVAARVPSIGLEMLEVAPEILAQNLAQLAAARLQSGERDDPLTLAPLYLAPSNAERNLAEKLAREAAP